MKWDFANSDPALLNDPKELDAAANSFRDVIEDEIASTYAGISDARDRVFLGGLSQGSFVASHTQLLKLT